MYYVQGYGHTWSWLQAARWIWRLRHKDDKLMTMAKAMSLAKDSKISKIEGALD